MGTEKKIQKKYVPMKRDFYDPFIMNESIEFDDCENCRKAQSSLEFFESCKFIVGLFIILNSYRDRNSDLFISISYHCCHEQHL